MDMEKEGKIANKIHHKIKTLKGFALFLAFMLFCTIVSRGIYAYRMPQVELGCAERKSIEHTFAVTGSIAAANEVPVLFPAGLLIDQVYVSVGDPIIADTVLAQCNLNELSDLITSLTERIALQEQRLQELKSDRELAAQSRQLDRRLAQENLDAITSSQELNVQQLRQHYEDVVNTLSSYPSWDAFFEQKLEQDQEYQSLLNDPEQEEALQNYVESLKLSLQEIWESGKVSAENAVKDAKNALQTAENDKNIAIAQATHAIEEANQKTTDVKSSEMEIEQTLEQLTKELEVYQSLWEQEGKLYCSMEGTIRAINICPGERTPDTASLLLTDITGGWIFETILSEEQMLLLNGESTVTLTLPKGYGQLTGCSLLTANRMENSGYAVTVDAGAGKLSQGMLGTLEFSSRQDPYDCCVPTSALYNINDRDYLFIIRETSTILGTELQVIRRQVKVVDRNDSFAALEDGTLGQEEQFVTNCESDLKNGDVVRPSF